MCNIFCLFIYCVCTCVSRVEVRGYLSRVGSLLLWCGFLGLNFCYQTVLCDKCFYLLSCLSRQPPQPLGITDSWFTAFTEYKLHMCCGSFIYHLGTYDLMEIQSLSTSPNAQTHSPYTKRTAMRNMRYDNITEVDERIHQSVFRQRGNLRIFYRAEGFWAEAGGRLGHC